MKVYTNLEMESRNITGVSTLSFNSSANNKIQDTGADLLIYGNTGIQLALNASGGIWTGSLCSTFRPITSGITDLGASTSRWKRVYVGALGIYFNDGTIQTTAGGGGGGWVGSATSLLDMNGYSIIDTTGVRGTTDLSLTAPDDVYIEAEGDDIYLDARDDIWITWNKFIETYTLRMNSYRVYPYSHACDVDLGTSTRSWDFIYASDIFANTLAPACDLAELQFTAPDVEPGDIVELADWEGWEKEHFDEAVKKCKANPCEKIKFFGYQGRWIKAKKRSTKCPSLISIQPAHAMGTTEDRLELYKQGKMNYVALSGSVPFVFIEGKFTSGDIIISAGNGKGMVDNDAKWNEAIGYAKRTGKDERCEIWIR